VACDLDLVAAGARVLPIMIKVATYVAIVSAAAVCAFGALVMHAPASNAAFVEAALYFSIIGVVAQVLNYQLARGASGSIAFIPFLATVAVAPSWTSIVAMAASLVVGELLGRRRFIKVVFNVAQHCLAASLAALVYLRLGGEPLLQDARFLILPYASLSVVFLTLNTVLVSAAVAISENRSVWAVWRANTLNTVTYDLISLPLVYVFGRAYVSYGAAGALGIALPLLGVRQLYKTNWQLEKNNQELLQLMVAAIEARDPYTSGHSRRVARYAKLIARALGLSTKQVERIAIAALLHDVGKIYEIFAPILRKPDRLTADELAIMQTHPIKSAELVQNVSQLKDLIAPIRHHHENWDGTGYPDGLAGEAIPLAARIIMVADTIDAMTTDRPYRKALDENAVRSELVRCSGTQFDPVISEALLASPLYPQLFANQLYRLTPATSVRPTIERERSRASA
jgi:putative nucleotidyltransferase with HDIG domain